MSVQRMYQAKVCMAEEAVQFVEPGEVVVFPINPGEPPALLQALPTNQKLMGNTLFRMLPGYPLIETESEIIKQVSIFLSGHDRKAFSEGVSDLLPNHFSDIPALLKMSSPTPVVMAAVSPMDEEGYFSLGTSVSYVGDLLDQAKSIILEVNQKMPRTFGEQNKIHISQVTALIENDFDLPSLPEPILNDKDTKIGQTIADLIRNGDTLQIGFGSMPNAVMEYLKDHRDLGIYTEMLPDKVVDLYEKGVITNANKKIYRGKTTATFALGSRRLYDFMNNNEDIFMLPCQVSNDLRNISQLDHLVSVNSTVEVDFLGQCNSEVIAGKYYSSTGGQADFAKGVRMTENGRGIICLYSTAKNDSISKIVPLLSPGSVVSTTKNDVDYVVTEFGKAELRGKTVQGRTEALINIAHPKFREELTFEAIKRGFLPKKNFFMI
ncbi:acetyl-CoA hydrolase/transferase family protein [Bacillus tuaregi]|uniref:acetyl-CoA hydrolase/transferase family protein n=1 Tax=Bacillus tuaregi TaxID=1816695 RepID=UPI0008F91371|nr:acetyl-CoA hydrolase/transferase C-terminal domain-containing protein [Bacillus tuaregi]